MDTVGPWSRLSPSNTNSTKVAQLNATIGTVFSEHSSIQLLKSVGKVPLRIFGRDNAKIGQYRLIFSTSTVLDF